MHRPAAAAMPDSRIQTVQQLLRNMLEVLRETSTEFLRGVSVYRPRPPSLGPFRSVCNQVSKHVSACWVLVPHRLSAVKHCHIVEVLQYDVLHH